jgi:ABC-type uncharacterized transport system ATPase subunit
LNDDIIQMISIVKVYPPSTLALDRVGLGVKKGEIHSIIGENGAGKSTLMKILYGMTPYDSGEIYFDGRKIRFASPREAVDAGIGMIHQEFMLIPSYTIWENVILGVEPVKRFGTLQEHEARTRIQALVDEYDLGININDRVKDVSVAARQKVEILKLLYRDIDILIMDEPTAVLTPQEIRELFRWLRHVRESGKTIIFISHKLDEVLEISDRITVMRQGKRMTTVENKGLDKADLARAMVGREVMFSITKPTGKFGDTVLEVEGLQYVNHDGQPKLDDISFTVRSGEILGLAGVEGNGQFELVQAITGLIKPQAGRIRIQDCDITEANVTERRKLMSYVPQDRKGWGSAQALDLIENSIMTHHQTNSDLTGRSKLMLSPKKCRKFAHALIDEFGVLASDIDAPIASLSGGNQQRLIVGREFMLDRDFILLDQPTRGLDVGSIEYIRAKILKKRDDGKGCLLVSADLDELLSLSDRILVMYRGAIVAEKRPEETSKEEIGEYMLLGSKGGKSK